MGNNGSLKEETKIHFLKLRIFLMWYSLTKLMIASNLEVPRSYSTSVGEFYCPCSHFVLFRNT